MLTSVNLMYNVLWKITNPCELCMKKDPNFKTCVNEFVRERTIIKTNFLPENLLLNYSSS